MSRVLSLFGEEARLQMTDSIRMSAEALARYVDTHDTWICTWSGGKDSTTVVTFVLACIQRGMIKAPKRLIILYADTRMEPLPLWLVASDIRDELLDRGVDVRVVMAPVDERFLVYMLGRGVPPPTSMTMRWCTRLIKVKPMAAAIAEMTAGSTGRTLLLTGVRLGESAARDQRIAISCTKDGGECGQARFQQDLSGLYDTLDPILHWRICHVWEWLATWAPRPEWGGWETRPLAEAYGGRDGDEAAEANARMGCVECPLVQEDRGLGGLLRIPRWSYLAPLRQLRQLYIDLRKPEHRLRKDGTETNADGKLSKNPNRWGPIKLESRLWALGEVLRIQAEVNASADGTDYRPRIDILNAEEETRIRELIAARTFPQKWTGDEIGADELIEEVHHLGDGAVVVQKLLPGLLRGRL